MWYRQEDEFGNMISKWDTSSGIFHLWYRLYLLRVDISPKEEITKEWSNITEEISFLEAFLPISTKIWWALVPRIVLGRCILWFRAEDILINIIFMCRKNKKVKQDPFLCILFLIQMHVLKIFCPHYERGLSQSGSLFMVINDSININECFAQLFPVKCV